MHPVGQPFAQKAQAKSRGVGEWIDTAGDWIDTAIKWIEVGEGAETLWMMFEVVAAGAD